MSLMSQLTFSQLLYLQSLPEELIEREYIRMLMKPSSSISNFIDKFKKHFYRIFKYCFIHTNR